MATDGGFIHVTQTVMGLPAGAPTILALQEYGCDNVADICMLRDPTDLDALEYTSINDNGDTESLPLPGAKLAMIRAFIHFVRYKHSIGEPIDVSDCRTIDKDEFNAYRVSSHFRPESSPSAVSTAASTTTSHAHQSDTLKDWQKGVKRDLSQFPTIRDVKDWDKFQLEFESTAKAQGVGDVLNPNYQPTTTEDRALLAVKNEFMYSVLVKCIKYDQGR